MPLSPVAATLALCALVLPISIAATNLALACLSVVLLLRARADARRIVDAWCRQPALIAMLLYAAVSLLAAVFSSAPTACLRDVIKDFHRLWSLGLFVAALTLEPKAPIRQALGASFGMIALYGIGQALFSGRADLMMVRSHAFVHPVVFGEQMALATLGGACALFRPSSRAERAAAMLFTAVVFAALTLSQTRMALFAAFAGFLTMLLFEPRARRWVVPALLIIAAVCGAWEFLPQQDRTLSSLFAPYDPSHPQQARWVLWDAAIRMFRDHPLTGVGPGGYQRMFASYYAGSLDGQRNWASAHNLYLHQLAERGLAGLLALLILCASLAARAGIAARADHGRRALWSVSSVAAFLIMSLTETAFQNEQFATLFLLIWAWGATPLE